MEDFLWRSDPEHMNRSCVQISLTLLLPSSAGTGEEDVDDMDELGDVSVPPARVVVDTFPRLSHSEEAAVFGVSGVDWPFSQQSAAGGDFEASMARLCVYAFLAGQGKGCM